MTDKWKHRQTKLRGQCIDVWHYIWLEMIPKVNICKYLNVVYIFSLVQGPDFLNSKHLQTHHLLLKSEQFNEEDQILSISLIPWCLFHFLGSCLQVIQNFLWFPWAVGQTCSSLDWWFGMQSRVSNTSHDFLNNFLLKGKRPDGNTPVLLSE